MQYRLFYFLNSALLHYESISFILSKHTFLIFTPYPFLSAL